MPDIEVIEEYNTSEIMPYEETSEKELLKNMLIELKQIRLNQEAQFSQHRELRDTNKRTKYIYCHSSQTTALENFLAGKYASIPYVRIQTTTEYYYEYQIIADDDKFNQISQDLIHTGIRAYPSYTRAPFFLSSRQENLIYPYFSAASGTEYGLYISASVSQSGTAGYSLIYGNVSTISSGSGAKYLFLLQSEGISRYYGDTSGNFYVSANVLCNSLMARENESTQNINQRTYSGSSGTKTANIFNITINQSGTAGYYGVVVNVTETSVGSGVKIPFEIRAGATPSRIFTLDNTGQIVFISGNEATGSGSASLGSNCPASSTSAPNCWLKFRKSDGTQLYIPAWA